jgi:hypothetical protein
MNIRNMNAALVTRHKTQAAAQAVADMLKSDEYGATVKPYFGGFAVWMIDLATGDEMPL